MEATQIWVCNQYIVKSKWKFLNLVIWIEFYALSHNLALLKLNNDFKFNIFKSYYLPKLGPTSSNLTF